jgi:hypothetical protein
MVTFIRRIVPPGNSIVSTKPFMLSDAIFNIDILGGGIVTGYDI